jgi:3-isopropylmalate/(R)-2-methylmalate dehydratase large subunit
MLYRAGRAPARSLFEKLWSSHVVAELGDDYALLHVDRHVLNDIVSGGLEVMEQRGHGVRERRMTFSVPDHMLPTDATQAGSSPPLASALRIRSGQHGIRLYDAADAGFGIVHVMAPEQGIALPGVTFACGDSHTSTIGALGALAWGVGQSEVVHILATQTSLQLKPKSMRVLLEGRLPARVTAKDAILHTIATLGVESGVGYAVEYAGAVVRELDMEGRFTVCNMSVEMGARFGMIAPDAVTFDYVSTAAQAPRGAEWAAAKAQWQELASDPDASFDSEITLDLSDLKPQVSWGTAVDQVVAIDASVPDPASEPQQERRQAMISAMAYMGLAPGDRLEGLPIDWVFIGSCTNARLSDLRAAAALIGTGHVHPDVRAWVVPGSRQVKAQAEAEGLDRVFTAAGFEWREPGCSMCAAANGDRVGPGQRSLSTTNRNFVGRQGPGARTHLASPETAVASALAGHIANPQSA